MSYPIGEEFDRRICLEWCYCLYFIIFVFSLPLFLSLISCLFFLRIIYLPIALLSFFYSLSLLNFFSSILSFLHNFFISVFLFPLFSTYSYIYFVYNVLIRPCTGMFLCICSPFDQLTGPGAGHLHLNTNIESVDFTVSCLICSRS
jgi:hypothetical protein